MSQFPLFLVSFLLFISALGCATGRATASGSLAAGSVAPGLVGPTRVLGAERERGGHAVFATVEAAVEDALASADRERRPALRERFLFGTIRRVQGGYVWTRPVRARTTVAGQRGQGVRLPLGAEDVAIYGVHPRSGHSELDRVNEQVSGRERQAVDGQDGEARPLYVLTPSRRIVRYPEQADGLPDPNADALEVVRREPPAAP